MQLPLYPNQVQIETAMVSFMQSVLPAGVPVVLGQANRVAAPAAQDYVVYWCIQRPRLATNVDEYADALFTGSIAGAVMTITDVDPDFDLPLTVGSTIFGVGVEPGTVVTAFGPGSTGGVGTYAVGPPQTVAPTALAAGVKTVMEEVDVVFQIDVHGPNSADNAQTISQMFRDQYATDQFAGQTPAIPVSPLYADDPVQRPFQNENQQIETRWVIDAHLQANQTITIPAQFAEALDVALVDVDAAYAP